MGTIENILTLRNTSVGYHGNEVLKEVNLDIKSGKLTVILGKNGSGKSTLIKAMAGLLPYGGEIHLDGQEVMKMNPVERAKKMAFLSQQHKAAFPFSVFDVVLTGRSAHVKIIPNNRDREKTSEALQKAGIAHLSERIYTELSGGEQQLVMIARLLAQESPLLLMDEPISHLDYPNQVKILELTGKLVGEGKTVVMILHDPNQAFCYGDHFVFVHDGHVIEAPVITPWNHPVFQEIVQHQLISHQIGKQVVFIPKNQHD